MQAKRTPTEKQTIQSISVGAASHREEKQRQPLRSLFRLRRIFCQSNRLMLLHYSALQFMRDAIGLFCCRSYTSV
ncbi:MAG: hypothetical protein V7K92_06870 [Nostoc sp.]